MTQSPQEFLHFLQSIGKQETVQNYTRTTDSLVSQKSFFFAFLNPKSESVCKRLEMDINQMSRRQRRRGREREREREVTLTIQYK